MTGNYPQHTPTQQERAEQAYASNIRFRNQLFLGAGSAIIFGLVSVLSKGLFDMAGASIVANGLGMAAAGPILGIVGIAALGLGCIYMGSKLFTKVIALDQERQAQKIHDAARGKEHDIDLVPQVEVTKTNTLPMNQAAAADKTDAADLTQAPAANTDIPNTLISQAAYQNRIMGAQHLSR